MLETVGKKLAKTRKAKSLSIEDVEHVTCIPHDRLRELEDDDYSQFANLTYAKSFLRLYSDFLGVDTADYRKELSLYEVDDFGADPLENEFAEADEPKRRPAMFAVVLLILMASLAGAYYFSEYYNKGKDGDGDGGEPPLASGSGIIGEGDEENGGEFNPTAKPPGEVPEKIEPETDREVEPNPLIGSEKPAINPEAMSPAEIKPLPFLPGEEPILPAVVIEDDELLNPVPKEADSSGSPEGEADKPKAGEPGASESEAGESGASERDGEPNAEEPEPDGEETDAGETDSGEVEESELDD